MASTKKPATATGNSLGPGTSMVPAGPAGTSRTSLAAYNSRYGRRADNRGNRPTAVPNVTAAGLNAGNAPGGISRVGQAVRSGLQNVTGRVTPTDPYALLFEEQRQRAMANIEAQLGAAARDIDAREQAAQGMVGGLPAIIQQLYAQGNSGLANAAGSLDAAQKASGLQSFMGAQAQMAPLSAAMSMDETARQADVPLLKQAVSGQASGERGALAQRRAEMEYEVQNAQDSRMLDYMMRQRERDQDRSWQRQDMALQRQWQLEDAMAASGLERDPRSGLKLSDIDKVRSSSPYRYVMQRLQPGGATKPLTMDEIYKKYQGNPNLLKVLALDLPELGLAYYGTGAE